MKSSRGVIAAIGLAALLVGTAFAQQAESPEGRLSDQRMASTPQELINALSAISFLKPEEFERRLNEEVGEIIHPLNLGALPQKLDEESDPRADITADEIQEYLDVLTEISIQSKRDGNLVWGRVQGTKYERQASEWFAEKLREFGVADVRLDPVPARRPLWRLDEMEFSVTSAPTLAEGEGYRFESALTAYQSATTVAGGVEAEIVFVGEGTPVELRGRDLEGKLVLLRARGLPGSLFHSARTAYSRIAVGEYGVPAGVIVWSDVPNASQVAARVGSVGGGENLGLVLPWTVINENDGYYLRELLDRATEESPVRGRLNVQGAEEGAEVRHSLNAFGVLPGRSGKYILYTAHIDGLLYGVHCNAGSVAMVLAVARHYAALPQEERAHGLIFLAVSDHENPGAGATDKWIEANPDLVEDLLVILRPEKIGLVQEVDEGWITGAKSNVAWPSMLMVTNQSPLLLDLFRRATNNYAIGTSDFFYADPASDETNFHPPYFDGGVISAGWTNGSRYYHSTADYEKDLMSAQELEKFARAHAFITDELGQYDKADLERDAVPYESEKSIYQSDALKLLFGKH